MKSFFKLSFSLIFLLNALNAFAMEAQNSLCQKRKFVQSDIKDAAREPYLICWDFDKTIMDGHVHNFVARRKTFPILNPTAKFAGILSAPSSSQRENVDMIVTDILSNITFKNKAETLESIQSSLDEGNKVAIVSFTLYPEVIYSLLSKLGLNNDELSNIYLRTGFPTKDSVWKQDHITDAMLAHNIASAARVILVDDSMTNVTKARESGNIGILVPDNNGDTNYLNTLNQILTTGVVPSHVAPTLADEIENVVNARPAKRNRALNHSCVQPTEELAFHGMRIVRRKMLAPNSTRCATSSSNKAKGVGPRDESSIGKHFSLSGFFSSTPRPDEVTPTKNLIPTSNTQDIEEEEEETGIKHI